MPAPISDHHRTLQRPDVEIASKIAAERYSPFTASFPRCPTPNKKLSGQSGNER